VEILLEINTTIGVSVEVFTEESHNGLIRLDLSAVGLFGYWTLFGSKPRCLNAASWSGVDLDSSIKGCINSVSDMRIVLRVKVPRWAPARGEGAI